MTPIPSPTDRASGNRLWLVQAAKARATGANVHKVNNLCQTYVCARMAAEFGDETADTQADALERRLQVFLRTGEVPREEIAAGN